MDELQILDDVTGWEAFMHWMALPWKVLFGIIPPV